MNIYLVTGHGTQQGRSAIDIAEQAVAGGVDIVMLRERDMSDEGVTAMARELKRRLEGTGVPLIIDGRVNVAKEVDADGVHLGRNDMEYAEARRILGKGKTIGVTCGTIEEVEKANELDVDYVMVAPVFGAEGSEKPELFGIEGLRMARKVSKHAVCAGGGIDASNVREVRNAGADWVAMRDAIVEPANPMKAASVLRFLIGER